jgi:Xaa-Pro aminopeptidase
MKILTLASLCIALLAASTAAARGHMGIDRAEYQARRQAVVAAAPDGVLLLHSVSAPKDWNDPGFKQDSNFFYLTGLQNLHDAILAVDGGTRQTWLFVMPPRAQERRRFAPMTGWDAPYLEPGPESERLTGVDHVVSWDGFADFIATRRKANPTLALYLDEGGQGKMVADVSNPPGFAPIENPFVLWAAAIRAKWPDARISEAGSILRPIRAVKSPAEVALLKSAALYTDAAFRAAMATIAPGRTNRQVEGAAVAAAFRAGADGVGMWPELKSGPVSGASVFQKAYDYHLMNRTLRPGETVLIDMGFNHEVYRGDVGRTMPVTGHFTPDQREVIDFMDEAYHAGLAAMRDGVTGDEVIQASIRYVGEHSGSLRSELARRAAVQLMRPAIWVMYTHGIDSVEIYPVERLHTGYAVAYGPDFDVGGVGFYEEDVSLITPTGHELINPALPYTSADIERTMAREKRSRR